MCLAVILSAAVPLNASAADGDSAPETVTVGFYALDGYHEMSDNGTRSGYGYDFFHTAEKYVNLNFEYVGYDMTWEDTMQAIVDGKIDVATSAFRTAEREEKFDFSLPVGSSSTILNTRADETRFTPGDYSTYDGMTVGLLTEYVENGIFEEFAEENGFSYTAVYYATSEELSRGLQSGEVDAVATTSLRKMENEITLSEFGVQNFYAIVKKGNTQLLDKINYAITQMNSNEGNWKSDFYYDNYTADNYSTLSFTDEELAFIERYSTGGQKLVIALDNDWKPFSWFEGGEYHGILADYIIACMDMAGMNYTFYDYEGSFFTATSETMVGIDLYACYGMPVSDDSGLLASSTMIDNGAALLQRRDVKEIKVVALAETTPNLNSRIEDSDEYEFVMYADTASAKQAAVDGDVDAAFLYSYDAEYAVNQDRTGKLAFTVVPDVPIELMTVMSKDRDHTLMSILMKCINCLPDTQKTAITSKYVSFSVTDMTIKDYIIMHPILTIVAVLIIVAVLVIVRSYIQRKYRKSLEGKVDEITALNGKLQENQEKLQETTAQQQAQLEKITALNDELEAKQLEVERACKEAEAANNAKTSFLFNMSHDIRTPMNAIIGFADLLEKHESEPDKVADYTRKIQDSGSVLLSIINNVLEMARIEKGTVAVDETVWNAEQFSDSLYSVFEDMMSQKNLEFTRKVEVTHPNVYGDPIKLREVFINLLSNAYKYTNSGGKVDMVLKELPCDREGYVIYETTIADTGIGMSEDFLPHIFEEFSREGTTTVTKIEGTGLGMPIVKRLVDLMDGTIEVESKKDVGTTFTVRLPHKIAEEPAELEQRADDLDTESFKGKRILLSEDNDLNAEISMEILGEAGFEVDRAEDGKVCVEMLENAEDGYYDVILMDIQMPHMNGYEATKVIRELPDKKKANIPIIAMTANAFDEDRRDARRAGMNGHLAKPVEIRELYKTLTNVFKSDK
jgi:signal transduction histidine kinase/ABC-type amino acid transport substrate-binding protein